MPSPVDFNPVPVVRWLVATFGLVCAVTEVVRAHLGLGLRNGHRFVLYLSL